MAGQNGLRVWIRASWRDLWQLLGVVESRAEAGNLIAARIANGDELGMFHVAPAEGEFILSHRAHASAPWAAVGRYATRAAAGERIAASAPAAGEFLVQFIDATPPVYA